MKLKRLFFTLAYLGASCAVAQTAPCFDDLYDVRKAFEPLPDDFYAMVLLFDINHDGVLEALVTDKDSNGSGSGMEYRQWYLYLFKDGEWEYGPQKEDWQYSGSGPTYGFVGGGHNGFYRLTREGQKPTLVSSWPSWNREDEGTTFREKASEVTIDDEGYLRSFPLPGLSTNYFATFEELDEGFTHPKLTDRIGPNDKLEPLEVMTLLPSEKQKSDYESRKKEGEKGGAAPSPAGLEGKGDENVAQASLPVPGHEAHSQGRLCYLLILPIICAILYFVRRKKRVG